MEAGNSPRARWPRHLALIHLVRDVFTEEAPYQRKKIEAKRRHGANDLGQAFLVPLAQYFDLQWTYFVKTVEPIEVMSFGAAGFEKSEVMSLRNHNSEVRKTKFNAN